MSDIGVNVHVNVPAHSQCHICGVDMFANGITQSIAQTCSKFNILHHPTAFVLSSGKNQAKVNNLPFQ